jgi:uncharacterized protein YjbI with pentapeptide repeats
MFQYQQMLLSGQPIFFAPNQPQTQREVLAQWVIDAMCSGQEVHLTNAILVGSFACISISVAREAILHNCLIRDSLADFSHSTFLQRADFEGTHFAQGAIFARCRFEADLMLDLCRFSGRGALFMDVEVKRALMAYGMVFDRGTFANFQRCHFHSIVKFSGSVFAGTADYNGTIFDGQATFCGATFRDSVSFGSCVFHEIALFCGGSEAGHAGTFFEGEATFVSVRFESQAAFQGAIFGKKVDFNLGRFEGFAFFTGVPANGIPPSAFKGESNFAGTRFLGQANFQGVTFADSVSFNSSVIEGAANFGAKLKADVGCTFAGEADFAGFSCEDSADFRGSVFHKYADFRNATFKQSALFTGAPQFGLSPVVFHGPALFGSSVFFRNADFRDATFKGRASFNGARIAETASFDTLNPEVGPGVRFEDEANFALVQITLAGNFRKARFMKAVSFSGARVDGPALFQEAIFQDSATFSLGRLSGLCDFSRTEFVGDLSLNEATARVLRFTGATDSVGPDQFRSKVDLRGCTYDRIEAEWRSLLDHLDPYDRQPYAQLEKSLRSVGEDAEASTVYLRRRKAERRRHWDRREFGAFLFSLLYWLLARYGVKPYRLIGYSAVLLISGTLVFLQPQSVSSKAADSSFSAEVAQLGSYDAFAVALHQFLPIDVPSGQEWTPSNQTLDLHIGKLTIYTMIRFSAIATILRIFGWILLPIGVASITGLLRRTT